MYYTLYTLEIMSKQSTLKVPEWCTVQKFGHFLQLVDPILATL